MNIYYTAKDIEELAEKGVKRLEVGPHVFVTDFARETANLYDIELVQPGTQERQIQPAAPASPQSYSQGRYNKPRGCQHGAFSNPVPHTGAAARPASSQTIEGASTVNTLVDFMGKMLKRGG